jgi:hypothetical protein
MAADRKLLGIYLNDHLAGSTVGLELAKRTRAANSGTELGRLLERLTAEIAEDRGALVSVMQALGVKRDPVKRAGAFIAERAGRLKLNGQLRGYSPLSRVVELEGLRTGVVGKRLLWVVLRELDAPELRQFDFTALEERAARQRDEIEAQRRQAAMIAFAG